MANDCEDCERDKFRIGPDMCSTPTSMEQNLACERIRIVKHVQCFYGIGMVGGSRIRKRAVSGMICISAGKNRLSTFCLREEVGFI